MNFKNFIAIGIATIGLHMQTNALAFDNITHSILQNVSTIQKMDGNDSQKFQQLQSEISLQSNELVQHFYNQLNEQGLIGMSTPSVNITFENKKDRINVFNAFAKSDQTVNIEYNLKGSIIAPINEVSLDQFLKTNLVSNENYVEFSLLHEIAHVQHMQLGYFNSPLEKIMSRDEHNLMTASQKLSYSISLNGKHQENMADMISSIWYLKLHNFSQESIDTLRSFSNLREIDTEHAKKMFNSDVISHDTKNTIDYILSHLDYFKQLKNEDVLNDAHHYVTLNTIKQLGIAMYDSKYLDNLEKVGIDRNSFHVSNIKNTSNNDEEHIIIKPKSTLSSIINNSLDKKNVEDKIKKISKSIYSDNTRNKSLNNNL